MADNGTAASGPTIAWDDIGSVAYQRVKPAWGVDGSAVDTSDTNPLPVSVRNPQTWFDIDIPGIAAAPYLAGEQYGSIITITNAARASGGSGWINSILYYDDTDVSGALDFLFFTDTVTPAADNATFALSDPDARKLLFIANMGYVTDLGAQRFGQVAGISVPYFCTGTSLFCLICTRSGFTPGAIGTQHVRFGLTRD